MATNQKAGWCTSTERTRCAVGAKLLCAFLWPTAEPSGSAAMSGEEAHGNLTLTRCGGAHHTWPLDLG
jgi:hypothetical protein